MPLRLGFDIDGVLANFRAAFRDAAARVVRREAGNGDTADGGSPLSPDDVRRVWDHIAKTPNWWMEIEPY